MPGGLDAAEFVKGFGNGLESEAQRAAHDNRLRLDDVLNFRTLDTEIDVKIQSLGCVLY